MTASIPNIVHINMPSFNVPPTVPEVLDRDEAEHLKAEIKRMLREQDGVLVSHYYTSPDLQDLADETGGIVSDSLEMARFGRRQNASTLIVAGVRFMGETAKILNPEKRILMPDLNAECSLDLGCPADAFTRVCDEHPDRTAVVYANTSAAVKARADWVVTSGIALDIVRHLSEKGEKILWAPDRHLGNYIQKATGADMLLWGGACVVHDEFKAQQLRELKQSHPNAKILVHPESPAGMIALADVVGSTTALIKATQQLDAEEFIIATDQGILHKMKQAAPTKMFLEAPTSGRGITCTSCAHCPWMAMNGLKSLYHVLKTGGNEIFVEEDIRQQAIRSINRMLDFAEERNRVVGGKGSA